MRIDNRLSRSPFPRRRSSAGFTLIELMVVVAIIGILVAIAYPRYAEYVAKSRRTDAKTALLGVAAREEQIFSARNQYSKLPADLGYAGSEFPVNSLSSGAAYYQINVTTNAAKTTFSASATPMGPQASDKCGSFSINELGVQSNTGNSLPTAECW